eukprot:2087430-Amphidinium_carterae.1
MAGKMIIFDGTNQCGLEAENDENTTLLKHQRSKQRALGNDKTGKVTLSVGFETTLRKQERAERERKKPVQKDSQR